MGRYGTVRVLEHDAQKAIMDHLANLHIFFYRANTGAVKAEYKGKERFVRYLPKGHPDLVLILHGRYIGLEVKRPGKFMSSDQMEFAQKIREAGGIYWVVRSVEDVDELLRQLRGANGRTEQH